MDDGEVGQGLPRRYFSKGFAGHGALERAGGGDKVTYKTGDFANTKLLELYKTYDERATGQNSVLFP